jgi:DNA-binding MarR family transcriptional regulator
MSDLAAQTALTSSGITRVVDRLVERGLVSRQSCATDRRTTYAVISESGRGLLARVLPGHLALAQEWVMDPLRDSATGVDDFVAGLRALRDHAAPCATAGSDGASLPVPRAAAG